MSESHRDRESSEDRVSFEMNRRKPYTNDLKSLGYMKVRKLGSGAFGRVCEVRDVNTGKNVAVKIFDVKGKPDSTIDLALDERRIWRQIKHPCLADLTRDYFMNERFYFCTDLATSDLHTHIKNKGLPSVPIAREWMKSIASGIHYLHYGLKVSHSDIKNENILMFNTYPEVKLADFGLCRQFSSVMDRCDGCRGTRGHQSPECISGESHDPFKSDVFSFGIVCFHLLTGVLPLDDVDDEDIVAERYCINCEIIRKRDARAGDLVSQALIHRANFRPTIKRVLKNEFFDDDPTTNE